MNKSIKPYLLLLFILLIDISKIYSQDPNFSNFGQNPLYYNPAYPGLVKCMDFKINQRNQWIELPGKFNTSVFSASIKLPPPWGCGLLLSSNNEGEGFLKTFSAGLGASFSFKIDNNKFFSFGLMPKIVYKKIDWSKLEFDDQFDELYGKIYNSSFISPNTDYRWFIDPLNCGFMFKYIFRQEQIRNPLEQSNLTFGFSLNHGTRPTQSLLGLDGYLETKKVIHANGLYWLNQKYGLNPGFIYESQQNFKTVTFGGNIYLGHLYIGNWIRTMNNFDSYILGAGIISTGNNKYMLGISYDFTLSGLRTGTNGTIELFLSAELNDFCLFNNQNKSKNEIRKDREKNEKCPEEPWYLRLKRRIKFV
ncbi:MAG: PorP/SprF family type IX secretion system membrane protein [Bacteroidota bacterium]|nr:PorP/SprF family type IX secretion system membrane protein [Bacteroidota bacterium]